MYPGLVERPECSHAHKFGFSVVCRHSDSTKYDVHVTGILTKTEALERHDILRQKRRDELTASLEETNRKIFCLKTDFFGQPVTNRNGNTNKKLMNELGHESQGNDPFAVLVPSVRAIAHLLAGW